MRVDDRHLTGSQAAQSGKANQAQEIERQGESKATGSHSSSSSDQVQLSELISGLGRALETAGTERANRMEQLAGEYAAGRYQVDSRAVSRAIVAEMRAAGAEPGT
jgi:anti-sigma28 factor (negative regulator of flagellin synthesis)